VKVIAVLDRWIKIESLRDRVEGYITKKAIKFTNNIKQIPIETICSPISIVTNISTNEKIYLTLGTKLYDYNKENSTFKVLNEIYKINSNDVNINNENLNIEQISKSLLNVPYEWGCKSVFGMDCSGFLNVIYSCLNIHLPRASRSMINCGQLIPTLKEAIKGDIILFDSEPITRRDRICHCGIYLGNNKVIHCASCGVKINDINEYSIYNDKYDRTGMFHINQIRRVI
jgi:cell wall-associated NlpC family hydrolase